MEVPQYIPELEDELVESAQGSSEPFESQFARREHIAVAGGMAEVVDVRPEHMKDEVPVFLAPGWAISPDVNGPILKVLTDEGRRVVTLDHPTTGGTFDELIKDMPDEVLEKYPPAELRKALNIIGVLDTKGIDKTDVIAHSEGAVNTIIAAMLNPEKFRSIVLVAPAGMVGDDNYLRLMHGFAGQSYKAKPSMEGIGQRPAIEATETAKVVGANAMRSFINYVRSNPARALEETLTLANKESQIHDLLRYLHEEVGIKIAVMAAVDDPVFHMDKIQETAKADMLDGFISMRGGHGDIGEHPELFVKAAESLLTQLKEKGEKEKSATLQ